MAKSREKERIESLKNQEISLHSELKTKQSLVFKISFLYLSLTLVNLLIFWVAVGSNQMALIKEKARYHSKALSLEVVNKLKYVIDNRTWHKQLHNPKKKKTAINILHNSLKQNKNNARLLLKNFQLISSPAGTQLYQYNINKQTLKTSKISRRKLQACIKAGHLKESFNKQFYGDIPNLSSYKIDLYIPITKVANSEVVLVSTISLASVKQEFNALILLALAMVAIMLIVQTLFGIMIYRILILPIKRLATGAQKISDGNLEVTVTEGKSKTEIDLLINVFNKMTASLKEKTSKLEQTIDELERHNKIVQNELDMARVIQQNLMPKKSISDRINMSVYYAPLEKVSGDYYDMFELSDGSIGILMCDASGHGIPAALVTMMAKVHFSGNAPHYEMPGDLLHKINQQLSRDVTTSDYLTAFYIIIRPDMTIHYSNGSHQLCIIHRQKSGTIEQLDSQGFFIGAIEECPFPYESMETKVEPGDRIILFTDGIVEGTNKAGEEYSNERFHNRIQEWAHLPLEEFNKKIIEDVDNFAEGEARKDDYSLIAIEIAPLAENRKKILEQATTLFKKRDFANAAPLFEQVIAHEPDNYHAAFYLGHCHFFEKKYQNAIPHLENYLQQNPDNSAVMLKLSISHEKSSNNQKAIEMYQKTLELDNTITAAYSQLALLYTKQGNQKKATDVLQEALKHNPSNQRLLKLKEEFVSEN